MNKIEVLKWVEFAKSILPLGFKAAGVADDQIAPAVALVGESEIALGDGTGTQKLQAVVDGLTNGMKLARASDETIAATVDAVTSGLNTTIKVVNDVHAIAMKPNASGASPT